MGRKKANRTNRSARLQPAQLEGQASQDSEAAQAQEPLSLRSVPASDYWCSWSGLPLPKPGSDMLSVRRHKMRKEILKQIKAEKKQDFKIENCSCQTCENTLVYCDNCAKKVSVNELVLCFLDKVSSEPRHICLGCFSEWYTLSKLAGDIP